MTRRRDLLGLVMLNAAGASYGQPSSAGKRRLGVLLLKGRDEGAENFAKELRAALADLGWIVDRNLTIEWRFADGDSSRLPALAAQVVASKPDAILTYFVPPTRALQLATKTIPIVTSVGDPVGFGFTSSYAHPDQNITGLSLGYVESQRKSIELLRTAVPTVTRLVLAVSADRAPDVQGLTAAAVGAARELGLSPEIAVVATVADLHVALRSNRISAMITYGFGSPSSRIKTGEDIALALERKVPTVGGNSEAVGLGALLSYLLYWDDQMQRNAAQLDKILRGVKPALIPFELPARSWVAVNLKTARALGLVLPPAVLARADEVIQ